MYPGITAAVLGAVHRGIGFFQQLGAIFRLDGKHGSADTHGHRHFDPIH
jgi:hypothetical protein